MKKLLLFVLCASVTVGAAIPALAFGPVDVEANLPLYSKYVWRGMVNVDDYVLQPSVDVDLLGFRVGFWGNMDLTDINDESTKFTEINWTLGYTLALPKIELGLGFIYYTFPQLDDADTVELYLSGQVNILLNPSLVIYQDLDAIKGGYWDASVSHGFSVGETSTLEVTAGLGLGSKGYLEGYFTGPGAILDPDLMTDFGASPADARISAALPLHPIPLFTVTPSVTYTSLLGDAKTAVEKDDALWYGKKDAFFWGLTAGFEF